MGAWLVILKRPSKQKSCSHFLIFSPFNFNAKYYLLGFFVCSFWVFLGGGIFLVCFVFRVFFLLIHDSFPASSIHIIKRCFKFSLQRVILDKLSLYLSCSFELEHSNSWMSYLKSSKKF